MSQRFERPERHERSAKYLRQLGIFHRGRFRTSSRKRNRIVSLSKTWAHAKRDGFSPSDPVYFEYAAVVTPGLYSFLLVDTRTESQKRDHV